VCDLCDGHSRRNAIDLAVKLDVPMIVHGADHFQLIDCGLDAGSSVLYWRDACWPMVAKDRGVFEDLYELQSFDAMKRPPLELYPFLYLPYDEEAICEAVLDEGLVVDPDPDVTNCDFVYLINVLELLRNGYPAYIHNTAAAILQGAISLEDAQEEIIEWLEEYETGAYDDQVFKGAERLGISLDQLIAAGPVSPCASESARGIPINEGANRFLKTTSKLHR